MLFHVIFIKFFFIFTVVNCSCGDVNPSDIYKLPVKYSNFVYMKNPDESFEKTITDGQKKKFAELYAIYAKYFAQTTTAPPHFEDAPDPSPGPDWQRTWAKLAGPQPTPYDLYSFPANPQHPVAVPYGYPPYPYPVFWPGNIKRNAGLYPTDKRLHGYEYGYQNHDMVQPVLPHLLGRGGHLVSPGFPQFSPFPTQGIYSPHIPPFIPPPQCPVQSLPGAEEDPSYSKYKIYRLEPVDNEFLSNDLPKTGMLANCIILPSEVIVNKARPLGLLDGSGVVDRKPRSLGKRGKKKRKKKYGKKKRKERLRGRVDLCKRSFVSHKGKPLPVLNDYDKGILKSAFPKLPEDVFDTERAALDLNSRFGAKEVNEGVRPTPTKKKVWWVTWVPHHWDNETDYDDNPVGGSLPPPTPSTSWTSTKLPFNTSPRHIIPTLTTPVKVKSTTGTLRPKTTTTSIKTEKPTTKTKMTTTSHHSTPEHSTTFVPDKIQADTPKKASAALKEQCEVQNQMKCICNVRNVVSELNAIVQEGEDFEEIITLIKAYECTEYVPLTNHLNISSDLTPRIITKKQKELMVGPKSGPKEIVTETLRELLRRDSSNDGRDFYVFPNTNVEIPCMSSNDLKLSTNVADSAKYKWYHGNNKAITEGRMLEDVKHKGSLKINGVTLTDGDTYTCKVSYVDPDTGNTTTKKFAHRLSIVNLPKLALHCKMHYTSDVKCEPEILEMFELYLPQQLENLICNVSSPVLMCTIEIYNPLCQKSAARERAMKEVLVLKDMEFIRNRLRRDSKEACGPGMVMSLNYELDLNNVWLAVPAATNLDKCNPRCRQKILLKIVDVLREAMLDALVLPVNSKLGTFDADLKSIKIQIVIACEGGYKLYEGFCVPCPAGSYSTDGSTECLACPPYTYQDNVASKRCLRCPHLFRPGCFSKEFLFTYLGIIAGIVCVCVCSVAMMSCCWRLCQESREYKRLQKAQRPEKTPQVSGEFAYTNSKPRIHNSKNEKLEYEGLHRGTQTSKIKKKNKPMNDNDTYSIGTVRTEAKRGKSRKDKIPRPPTADFY